MNEVIHCPECRRRLELPEDIIGKHVQCSACHRPFVAEADLFLVCANQTAGSQIPNLDKLYPPPKEQEPYQRIGRSETHKTNGKIRRLQPSAILPHRAGFVLTVGILGVVIPILGFFVALEAWKMGWSDLRQMQRGFLDECGEILTRIGMCLALIGMAVHGLACLFVLFFCLFGRFVFLV